MYTLFRLLLQHELLGASRTLFPLLLIFLAVVAVVATIEFGLKHPVFFEALFVLSSFDAGEAVIIDRNN